MATLAQSEILGFIVKISRRCGEVPALERTYWWSDATFDAIPTGVTRRLALLTSVTPDNKDKRLDQIYPYSNISIAGKVKRDSYDGDTVWSWSLVS